MWVVADEPFDQTLVDYALLLEAERLAEIKTMDRQYHLAKLVAAAFNEPKLIWEEHGEFRRGALTPTPVDQPALSPELLAKAAALWKRARAAEARHGAH